MKLRYCPRERLMVPWVRSGTVGRPVKACASCAAPTRPSKPKPPKHQAADRRWSKAVRERDGGLCRRCGKPAGDGAHIIRRSYKATRHNPANGLALCRGCHEYMGKHGEEWRAFLKREMPDLYAELALKAGAPVR